MKTGTKSLLFGIHQFIIHPFMVLWAWLIVYRKWPCLYELAAIITHDWGYWGCEKMDDDKGENHPQVMVLWWWRQCGGTSIFCWNIAAEIAGHSRFHVARHSGCKLSKLFRADKLAVALYPRWIYLLLGSMSGEIHEYMEIANDREGKYIDLAANNLSKTQWLLKVQAHMIMMGLEGEEYEPVKKQLEGR